MIIATFAILNANIVSKRELICFNNIERAKWLSDISLFYNQYANKKNRDAVIHIGMHIKPSHLEPIHLVTLACLIQYLKDNGVTPFMGTDNQKVCEYIMEDLGFQKYWSGGLNHVEPSKSDNIFNLWRITDSEKDLYAKHVEKYLRSNYFEGKDLGAVSLCLAEAFYNVFDHAQAKGNAFSLLAYDVETSVLRGAICDFGVGLATTIRKGHPEVSYDDEAIRLSIEDNVTIGSTARNRGLGMGNIVNNTDSIRILSGSGLYVKNYDNIKTVQTTFSFPGTLIYFDIDLSSLEDETLLDNFNW